MSPKPRWPPSVLEKIKTITGKRARIVVEHILKHGSVSTEELKEVYGYDHPPRAIKDVTDQGLPLERKMITSSSGKKMAQYTFGDPSAIRNDRHGGRTVIPVAFKEQLVEAYGSKCMICSARLEKRYLQVDHRIPYEVAADPSFDDLQAFMPLCGSCNRAKSWSCEHCDNWRTKKDVAICQTCYWANPVNYDHIAETLSRRLDVQWTGDEVPDFDALAKRARKESEGLPEFVKKILRRLLMDRS
jgi:hypothetical protein